MKMSMAEAMAHNAKFDANGKRREILAKVESAVQAEREVGKGSLHEQIEAYCKSKGWYYVHSRTDRPSTNQIGCPDFVIATERGTVWIEAKARNKKPTTEQIAAIAWLRKLGHKAAVVWSMEEFVAAVEGGDAH